MFVVEIFTKHGRGLLLFAAPCIYASIVSFFDLLLCTYFLLYTHNKNIHVEVAESIFTGYKWKQSVTFLQEV